MSRSLSLAAVTAVLLLITPASAAEKSLSKEHKFLKKFAGTWECASDCRMAEGQPPMKTRATSTNRMIGDFWVMNEIVSSGGGAAVTAIQTIGFDEKKKKFHGTWIDSMVNHLWSYEGTLNDEGTILTMEAEGPNFMTGEGTAQFRDIYEFKSDNHILARSLVKGETGKWVEVVKGESKRVAEHEAKQP